MDFLKRLEYTIQNLPDLVSFCIQGQKYTYRELGQEIQKIRVLINSTFSADQKIVGLLTYDDLSTYASIIALWFEGKAYVPINPNNPIDRNDHILESIDNPLILGSQFCDNISQNYRQIDTTNTIENINYTKEVASSISKSDIAYIIFTSGSTGIPKGVPISFQNLQSFITAIDHQESFQINKEDRCSQMFELSFDFSVVAFLLPLLEGASVYTIPSNAIKYLHLFKLLIQEKLTVLSMVPSIINYLKPYFEEINAPWVRYCSFGGGALDENLTLKWSNCIPNAAVFNYYGPTETTIYSSCFEIKASNLKSYHGTLSIGTPLHGISYLLKSESGGNTEIGEIGELCISGNQVTQGYWKRPDLNSKSFFTEENNGIQKRFYRSGDLCIKDEEGYFLYVGRKDFQVKIRGFRVELSEIEFQAKTALQDSHNLVVTNIKNDLDQDELAMVIEGDAFDYSKLKEELSQKLPDYMIPRYYEFIDEMPHNSNGKVNRKAIKNWLNHE